MKSNINKEQIKNKLQSLKSSKTEDQLIERDSMILQANYLSEIERISREEGFNRKELAIKIKTSPSYLTQVFRGDKPLNFLTIAKIKRALNIRFDLTASLQSDQKLGSYKIIATRHKFDIPNKPNLQVIRGNGVIDSTNEFKMLA